MAALVRLRIDLATGAVARRRLLRPAMPTNSRASIRTTSRRPIATPTSPSNRAAISGIGLQQRITRVDLESGATVSHDFAPHGYPGEPVFIPARPDGEEDDGFVVTLVFDAADGPHADRGTRCT